MEDTAGEAWYALSAKDVVKKLESDETRGLASEEASGRLGEYGPNDLPEKPGRSAFSRFIAQFNDFTVWILIVAIIISAVALKEIVDAAVIAIIVIANAILGYIQEGRAEQAIGALRVLAAPAASVIRNGEEMRVPARELVPGDIILLESGARVPADARLLSVTHLMVNEATLTGESVPAEKHSKPAAKSAGVLDRSSMVYLGTTVATGRAKAIVTSTGPRTEMGKIAELVQGAEERQTPLQEELNSVGKTIAIICIAIAAVVFLLGVVRGNSVALMFLAAVSLAVAAIPEGLPAIVTITLALGLERMAEENAIVRRLSAVETLGSATVICTDKTGTLTRNEMRIGVIDTGDQTVKLSNGLLPHFGDPKVTRVLMVGAIANDARKGAEDVYIGDPTEIALLMGADDNRLSPRALSDLFPRVAEIPFESERRMMTTINQMRGADLNADHPEDPSQGRTPLLVAFTKGAPEIILEHCTQIFTGSGTKRLTKAQKKKILDQNAKLAGEAYRMLGFAYKPLGVATPELMSSTVEAAAVEHDMVFVGLAGLTDPPRPEAFDAIKTTRAAGIKVVMITGDHLITAKAIGKELGLVTHEYQAISSDTLRKMSDTELDARVEKITVYARASAEDKMRIITALRNKGEVIAMTGDGVNDAPALKESDIGIAMGQIGSDVTREASDMILTDDNFATIVRAIAEGRVIFDNLKKFVYFLLSCNISEVLIMFLVMLFSKYTPLWPVQILWVNLVTDGLPALALGVDVAEPGIMTRPPRRKIDRILSLPKQGELLWQGLLMTAGALVAYLASFYLLGKDLDGARTVLFAALVFVQLLHAFNSRSETNAAWEMGLFSNRYLIWALVISTLLELVVIYTPFLQSLFHTEPLLIVDWLLVAACAIIPVGIIELVKAIRSES